MAKYLDETGLRRVWAKTKSYVQSYVDTRIDAVSNGSLVIKLQTTNTGGGYQVM